MNPTPPPPTTDPVLEPLESFAKRAREYAHDPRNWIDYRLPNADLNIHAEHLRFKLRLQGWSTALTFWYTVETNPKGETWRHLSIQCSQNDMAQVDAEILRQQIQEYKAGLLDVLSPTVSLFFPLQDEVAIRFDVGQPIPVQNPETRQVLLRVPMTFHFFVPWTNGEKAEGLERFSSDGKNVATGDPRLSGWRPGSEYPDTARPVLAWTAAHGFAIWEVLTDLGEGPGYYHEPPDWWHELPEPPVRG